MRFVDIARASALLSLAALMSACPKKDSDAAPEPAPPSVVQAPVTDKAGAEAPAPPAPAAPAKKKADEDKGGW
jgi:hypothetical protein